MPIEARRQSRAHRKAYDHGEPLRWISLTPLAGVFAIAGALVASAYGAPPNAVMVDLPMPPPEGMGPLTPDVDRLILTADRQILWNATPVSEEELVAILQAAKQRDGTPALLFTPEADAPYAFALHVLDLLRQHGALDRCFRFSGIARYRAYDRPETFDELLPYTREDCWPEAVGPSMPAIRQ